MNKWRTWSWKKRIAAVLGGGFLSAVLLVIVGYLATPIPSANSASTNQATVIRYADGGEIGRVGAQNRQRVPLASVADSAQKAVLAAEDRGYYTEPGISPRGILRALFTNVKGGGSIQQGGSTITQQYAKNAYLTQNRTYTRKIKEVFIALKLSRKLSKDEVLERYLNTIYFGRGASGIEVASKTYFNRSAKDLTVAQAAVLAATIRSPGAYDPTRHPQRAKDRWNYVLDGMVSQGWLSKADRDSQRYPTVLKPGEGKAAAANDRKGPKGYILDMVEEELAAQGFSEDRLAQGGFVVRTTLRRAAQEAAVKAVQDAIPQSTEQSQPAGALVSIAPSTGEVWAYYGGSEGNASTDYASGEARQPGSSFKPYVLATALEAGKGLGTRLDGSSPQKICNQRIQNDAGDPPMGQTDLVRGLYLSVNTVYYRLACDVGPKKIKELAYRAGISGSNKLAEKDGVTAAGIGLGIYEVSVLDQATGYATFANGGEHQETHFVKSVATIGGDVVFESQEKKDRAFSEDVAADATYAMTQVVQRGTGTRAKIPGRPTAGKTGTTQENVDAWFCGFTPQLATAVWVGRPDRKPLRGVLGSERGVYGGTVPAKIFADYMTAALEGQPVENFPKRANVGKNFSPDSGRTFSPRPTDTASASPSPSSSAPPSGPPTQAPPPSQPASEPPPSPPPATQAPSASPPATAQAAQSPRPSP
ncbi:MAG: transglycosylase domain-containing protein [Mycobacteriales bacterium]